MNQSNVFFFDAKLCVRVCWIVSYVPGPGADSVVTILPWRAKVMYQGWYHAELKRHGVQAVCALGQTTITDVKEKNYLVFINIAITG